MHHSMTSLNARHNELSGTQEIWHITIEDIGKSTNKDEWLHSHGPYVATA